MPKPGQVGIDLSPDGQTLAVAWRDTPETTTHVGRISVDGIYREIYTFPRLNVMPWALWTKDGQNIFIVQKENSKLQMMRLGANGGEPSFTGLELAGNSVFADISPDGSRLAFSNPRTILQVWAADNILSAVK